MIQPSLCSAQLTVRLPHFVFVVGLEFGIKSLLYAVLAHLMPEPDKLMETHRVAIHLEREFGCLFVDEFLLQTGSLEKQLYLT